MRRRREEMNADKLSGRMYTYTYLSYPGKWVYIKEEKYDEVNLARQTGH